MSADWPVTTVGQVATKVTKGTTPTSIGGGFADAGINFVKVESITADGRIDPAKLAKIDDRSNQLLSRSMLAADDVLFTIAGTIGRAALVEASLLPANTNQAVAIVRPRMDQVLPRFLYFVLRDEERVRQANTRVVQSVQANFSLAELSSLEFSLPPIHEQRAIADALGTLDDKIEVSRRMSETLESIARALFKSWFVDFDPVRARAEGRKTALPTEIARLFPDALENTEHGEIPKGWSYRPLGELVDLTRGRTYKGNLKGLPGPVLLGLASIRRNGGFRDDNLSTYGGESPEDLLVYPGELFASLKDVTQAADLLGAVARVPGHVKAGRLTQDTVKLRLKSERTSRSILYRCLLTDAYRAYCRAHATGTTNLGLSRDDFLAFPIPQPSEAVSRLYDSINLSLDSRMALLVEESRMLAATRDLLLPKLISGELRVDPVRTPQHIPSAT